MRRHHRHLRHRDRSRLLVAECRSEASQFFSVRVLAFQDKARDRDKVRARGKMLSEPIDRRCGRVNAGDRIPRVQGLRVAVRHLDREGV